MNTFNNQDFGSPNGMLTTVWGPSLWHSLHTISFNYPVKPSKQDKVNYFNMFLGLQNILPCKICRVNLHNNLKIVPLTKSTMKNRHTFSLWLYKLHEQVNKMLNKTSNLSYNNVRDRYEMFRSRCITSKHNKPKKTKKKERGCTTSLYGKKSKCIITIVPINNKQKTFSISNKCKLYK
jgi:hypothetical protein